MWTYERAGDSARDDANNSTDRLEDGLFFANNNECQSTAVRKRPGDDGRADRRLTSM